MLDEYADKPLHGPEDHPVEHDGPLSLAVLVRVVEVEALGQGKVELDGGALPLSAQGVLQLHIDLRPVERAVSLIDIIGERPVVEDAFKYAFRLVPVFDAAYEVLLRPGADLQLVLEPEDPHDVRDERCDAVYLVVELVLPAERYGHRPG